MPWLHRVFLLGSGRKNNQGPAEVRWCLLFHLYLSLCAAEVGLVLHKETQRCCLFFLTEKVSEEVIKIM